MSLSGPILDSVFSTPLRQTKNRLPSTQNYFFLPFTALKYGNFLLITWIGKDLMKNCFRQNYVACFPLIIFSFLVSPLLFLLNYHFPPFYFFFSVVLFVVLKFPDEREMVLLLQKSKLVRFSSFFDFFFLACYLLFWLFEFMKQNAVKGRHV